MRVVGITAEYNPFHNGHAYQIAKAREIIEPDCVAVCMSGDFTQRGSAAIMDKWTRAELALADSTQAMSLGQAPDGADLVVELPFVFACNRAPIFACGGVDTLVSLGATHIAFGCEAQNTEELLQAADDLHQKADAISQMTAEAMKEGNSYAKAYELAVTSVIGQSVARLLQKPNNILAVEYLKRIRHWQEHGKDVKALPIQRIGSGYTDANAAAGLAGATAIRQMILASEDHDEDHDIKTFVPASVYERLPDGVSLKKADDKFYELIRAELVRKSPEELACIYSIGEGIENRFKKSAIESDALDHLIEAVTSRRYTSAAVRRMLTYILLGLGGNRVDLLLRAEDPSETFCRYIRLLAANERGRNCIRSVKEREGIPFITNVNKDAQNLSSHASDMLAIDILAADMWNILFNRNIYENSDKVRQPYIEK